MSKQSVPKILAKGVKRSAKCLTKRNYRRGKHRRRNNSLLKCIK